MSPKFDPLVLWMTSCNSNDGKYYFAIFVVFHFCEKITCCGWTWDRTFQHKLKGERSWAPPADQSSDPAQECFTSKNKNYNDGCDHSWNFSSCVVIWYVGSSLFVALRYESSTLILYKELSSPIFQMWVSQSVCQASVTPVQISTFCNI